MIIRAMNLVDIYFKDKKDKGGNPYTEHLIYVMQNVETTEEKVVALLHDIMEDTDITEKEISDFGIQKVYIDAVKILTKKSCESYDQYINRIIKSKNQLENQLAINVKIVDLEHNMNLDRLKIITSKDMVRNHKYKQAYNKLLPLKKVL